MVGVARKKGISNSERLLREKFAMELSRAIGVERGAQTQAAQRLGVSRQAISLYLARRATPGGDILRRACELWPLDLNIRGVIVDADSYKGGPLVSALPEQRSLFDAISAVENQQMKVTVLRKAPSSLELRVMIDFDQSRRA